MLNKKVFGKFCKECYGDGVLINSLRDRMKCPACNGEGVITNVKKSLKIFKTKIKKS